MDQLERIGNLYKCSFCDLFVKELNEKANAFYKRLGYTVYRRIRGYYGSEDGYDDRKPLAADTEFKSVQNAGKIITKWVDYDM